MNEELYHVHALEYLILLKYKVKEIPLKIFDTLIWEINQLITVSPLHMNQFHSKSAFVSPICSLVQQS